MIKQTLKLLLVAAVFAGCNEATDQEKPVVAIENPADGQTIATADDLRLVATVSDDTGLLQYKLTISGLDELNDVGADSTLHYIHVEGIQGDVKTIFLDETIELDDNTFNGNYYATLTAVDKEGNEAVRDTVKFVIENSIDGTPPTFNVTGPTADTLSLGMGFSPGGQVADSQNLIYSDIFIGRTDGSQEIHSFQFTNIIDNTVDYGGLGWYFQVDSTWTQGSYHVYFTAWDNYSGVSHEIPFYVSY